MDGSRTSARWVRWTPPDSGLLWLPSSLALRRGVQSLRETQQQLTSKKCLGAGHLVLSQPDP